MTPGSGAPHRVEAAADLMLAYRELERAARDVVRTHGAVLRMGSNLDAEMVRDVNALEDALTAIDRISTAHERSVQ